MALLKVLMSMTLLVVITFAEFPSQHSKILTNNKVLNDKKTIVDQNRYSEKVEPPKYRLPDNIVPLHYDIALDLDLTKLELPDYKYDGTVNIELDVKEKTKSIKLHYTNSIILKKTELSYFDSDKKIVKKDAKEVKPVNGTDISELIFENDIEKGNYHLELNYKGVITNLAKGFYKGSYLDEELQEQWYVVTDFEPIGARNAFPCFDEPHLKATFSIKIKYNKGYTAISNMAEDTKTQTEGFEETLFKTTPKMSTYLVAYAVTKFSKREDNNVIVYSRPVGFNMTKSAATFANKVLEFMNKYTDINILEKVPKMKQIALPSLKPGAMENWGLVTYKETALLYDKEINKTIDEQQVASIISHELAHQWFGNLVTLKWWKYVWLNEGFATYFQYLVTDEINKEWHFMDQFNVKSLQNALAYDAEKTKSRPLDYEESSEKEVSDSFDTISYDKGASVIRMFSHVLNKDTFQKGLQKYLQDNQLKAVESADLFKALKEVANKTVLPDKIELPTVFESWTNQAGYPVITVTVNRDAKKSSITVKQEPFAIVKEKDANKNAWYVPLNYVQQKDNSTFSDTSVQHWLLPNKEVTIDKDVDVNGWIIFNVQQTGYYRVNYDNVSWDIITESLLNDDLNTIHPLNRAQLVDDAFNLAYAGLLDYNVTLKLVKYLERETDYIVWKAALNGLSTMNKRLGLTELYKEFLIYLKPIVHQLYNLTTVVESEKDDYLTKLLRVDAIKWACALGSSECQNQSIEQVRLSFDPKNNVTLSPDLKKVTLCAAVRSATKDEWEGLFIKGLTQSMSDDERIEMFTSLGCSSSSEILSDFLHKFIHMEPIKMYFLETFETIYSNNPIGVKVILGFLDKHLKQLRVSNHKFDSNLWNYLNELGSRVVNKDDVNLLQHVILASEVKDSEKILDVANRNMKWFEQNEDNIKNYLIANNNPVPVPTTTAKPNSSSSLTFTSVLITVSILLAALQ